MKIKVINNRELLNNMEDSKEKMIYITFRPSDKDIFETIKKFKNLKMIALPISYLSIVSKTTKNILEFNKIELISLKIVKSKYITKYYEMK